MTGSIETFLAHQGVLAVFVLMAIDAVFPAASELVMLYGGALASGALSHKLDVFGTNRSGLGAYLAIVVAGILGYQVGALAGWAVGSFGGRPLLERHGRLLHLNAGRLARAERWFERWENWAVLIGRITPVARSFVSIPAGVFGAPLARYNVLTLIGNAAWCFAFAAAGWALGASWSSLHGDFGYVEYAVVAGFVLLVAYLVVRRRRSITMGDSASDTPR